MEKTGYRWVLPVLLAVVVAAVALESGGSDRIGRALISYGLAAFRSADHFIAHERDPGVLYEAGSEELADKVACFLPSAVQQIEQQHGCPFARPVRVYVCASRKRFMRMYGGDARAAVLTRLLLSPGIFEDGDSIARLYLIHELSHLHLLDRIGIYKISRLPTWFKEGLAT